ncbi:MAG: SDR family NAD(P)-dependent oxidoreductase [Candidatus Lokiarchaeota archaeon]|nr:SDR family NAD(P)-dependent oxidoreductase [Candidatus Lokiarchaeota archaeon]MBD3239287.1 SDR family NAD(P)-dependent oxidoreductase [Chitinivibrionales bacterium]
MGIFERKTAIVTGATGGIGHEIVNKLCTSGIGCVVAGRNEEKLRSLMECSTNGDIIPVRCDVTRLGDLQKLVEAATDGFGKIDILINCAGITSQHHFWEQPIEEIEMVVMTNYYSYVALTRLVVPHMKERGDGHIINITSGSVMVDPPPTKFAVYTSLKVALRSFAKGLFWEMRDFGVKVTSIFPGVTKTPLTNRLENVTQSVEDRLMDPEVIADTVLFAINLPDNVSPLELAVGNRRTPWVKPIIPVVQDHPSN